MPGRMRRISSGVITWPAGKSLTKYRDRRNTLLPSSDRCRSKPGFPWLARHPWHSDRDPPDWWVSRKLAVRVLVGAAEGKVFFDRTDLMGKSRCVASRHQSPPTAYVKDSCPRATSIVNQKIRDSMRALART